MPINNEIVKTSSDIENVDWSTGTTSGPHYQNVVRFGSSSSQASQSSGDICRICHCESDPQNPLLTPCYCSGSLKYVHQACLQQWLTASETNACELCKFPFIMHTKIKPFNEWRSLDMSGVERRRLCCAVLFHCAAALCVIWSLCVLIERAAEEVKRGLIGWPFWTKLAVVTVGLTGGVVFMYIQCRQYLHLCHRWRARNRILLIQNAPEKVHPLSPPSPILTARHLTRNSSATAGSAMTTNSCNYSTYGGGCGGGGIGGGYSSAAASLAGGNRSSSNNPHLVQHGQIVANIENNSQNYDRDWTLDDVSQISSFRPCPQGSGSMTPFHDSFVQNALENSMSCSNSLSGSRQDLSNLMPNSSNCSNRSHDLVGSGGGGGGGAASGTSGGTIPSATVPTTTINTEGAPSKMTSTSSSAAVNKYPHSSVFLENSDILNDVGYPRINYRHSSILMSPDISDNLDKFLGKDLRRYSDTKLLQHDDTSDVLNPIFNVALRNSGISSSGGDSGVVMIGGNEEYQRQRQSAYSSLSKSPGMAFKTMNSKTGNNNSNNNNNNNNNNESSSIVHNLLGAPQITDIIFESSNQYDPRELNNIQEMLELDGIGSYRHGHGGQLHQQQQQQQIGMTSSDNRESKKSRHSLNCVEPDCGEGSHSGGPDNGGGYGIVSGGPSGPNTSGIAAADKFDKSRLFFKSLPNLSSSCESLIKK